MDLIIEHVSWNRESLAQQIYDGLSEDQFVDRGVKEGHYGEYAEGDQVALLKMVFTKIKNTGC